MSKKKRKKTAKSVKYWTLITIDSENCDPKRLTPRQQLAYIAKRAQCGGGGGQLMSDFHQHSQYQSDPMPLMLSTHSDVLASDLGSVQEHMNDDLHEIAGAELIHADSAMAFSDELIEMAEAEEEMTRLAVEEEELAKIAFPPSQNDTCSSNTPTVAYLEPILETFFDSVNRLRDMRLQIFEADRARRLALARN